MVPVRVRRTLRAALEKSRSRRGGLTGCIRSSLQTATLNDRCEVVRTLLKLGADMEIKDAQVGVPYDGPNSTQAQERERTRSTLVALHLARCTLHTQA